MSRPKTGIVRHAEVCKVLTLLGLKPIGGKAGGHFVGHLLKTQIRAGRVVRVARGRYMLKSERG